MVYKARFIKILHPFIFLFFFILIETIGLHFKIISKELAAGSFVVATIWTLFCLICEIINLFRINYTFRDKVKYLRKISRRILFYSIMGLLLIKIYMLTSAIPEFEDLPHNIFALKNLPYSMPILVTFGVVFILAIIYKVKKHYSLG